MRSPEPSGRCTSTIAAENDCPAPIHASAPCTVVSICMVHGRGEALAVLAEHHDVDLVLSDLMMPGGNGAELYQQIARYAPALEPRVRFMTGGGRRNLGDDDRAIA